MSYPQFGYTYPPSSQLLMTGQHPANSCYQPGENQTNPSVCSLSNAYDSRLLSPFPRLPSGLAVYSSSYPDHVTAFGTSPTTFYSSLPGPYNMKDGPGSWTALPQATCYAYDPALAAYGPYGDRYGSMDSVARRKNATRETTNTLKAWLYEHRKNPYPTKGEKIMLAIITKMTLTQVSTWFANARRRLKKENKMTWEPRNKTSEGSESECKSESPIMSRSEDDSHKKSEESDESDDERQGESINEEASYQETKVLYHGSPTSDHTISSEGATIPLGQYDLGNTTDCALTQEALSNDRPKIWSLAHTATSNSPPILRRSPTSDHYLEQSVLVGYPWVKNELKESPEAEMVSYPIPEDRRYPPLTMNPANLRYCSEDPGQSRPLAEVNMYQPPGHFTPTVSSGYEASTFTISKSDPGV